MKYSTFFKMLDISCESSARQRIHMKYSAFFSASQRIHMKHQALFSLKKQWKNIQDCRLLQS